MNTNGLLRKGDTVPSLGATKGGLSLVSKKWLCIVLLLAGLATPATVRADKFFGVVGGLSLNRPDLNGKLTADFSPDNRYGWYAGVKFGMGIMGLGFDVSALYCQRRLNLNEGDSETFRSVELPVNLKVTAGVNKFAAIFIATGPQFGFNVGDRDWKTDSWEVGKSTFRAKNANVSWNVGAGARFLDHLEVGVSYNIALTNYARVKEWAGADLTADDYRFRTNTFQVQVGVIF